MELTLVLGTAQRRNSQLAEAIATFEGRCHGEESRTRQNISRSLRSVIRMQSFLGGCRVCRRDRYWKKRCRP
jgi:hypothetical protein